MSLPNSIGVPSTLSICRGRSRWYWKTYHRPLGDEKRYGRNGAAAAAAKATSGHSQRRG